LREVVLLQKAHDQFSLRALGRVTEELCEGLKVELLDLRAVENSWVSVKLRGEDEDVAVRFLARIVGLAPVDSGRVEPFSVLQGKTMFSQRDRLGLFVDVGVFSPEKSTAFIPLHRLQAQLTDGRKIPLQKIAELFALVNDFPLEVRIVGFEANKFETELTEAQLGLYSRWIGSRVDHLVVLGALRKDVERAAKSRMLRRDVVGSESLGIFEHAVICKLGTDAAGLVPKLSRELPRANFERFSPRQVLRLLKGRW